MKRNIGVMFVGKEIKKKKKSHGFELITLRGRGRGRGNLCCGHWLVNACDCE